MKKYIVITTGGFTQDDCGNEVENCQVIGKYTAPTGAHAAEMARGELLREKRYFAELQVYELVGLRSICDYSGTIAPEE